jgi:hypothetical protein
MSDPKFGGSEPAECCRVRISDSTIERAHEWYIADRKRRRELVEKALDLRRDGRCRNMGRVQRFIDKCTNHRPKDERPHLIPDLARLVGSYV